MNLPAASDADPEPVITDDELSALLGTSKRTIGRMRDRGQLPPCSYQLTGRNLFRTVSPRRAAHDAIARLYVPNLPEARKEVLAVGREVATERRREKRDIAFLAKRVLVECGADELAAILRPVHTGPLRDVRKGHGPLIRIALKSALRHAGVRDTQ